MRVQLVDKFGHKHGIFATPAEAGTWALEHLGTRDSEEGDTPDGWHLQLPGPDVTQGVERSRLVRANANDGLWRQE